MPVPVVYRKQSPNLVNYDYIDFADGTGIVGFYGLTAGISDSHTNDVHILSKNPIISALTTSSNPYTTISSGNSTTFSVTFQRPTIIEGNLFCVLPIHDIDTSGCTPLVDIYHYDGTTATSLVTQIQFPDVTGGAKLDVVGKFTIPKTKFKVGDTLQFKITAKATGATVRLWHDTTASNTDFPYSGGSMKVYVPFLIQE